MKSFNLDLTKVALVFGMMAFQLHILTMTTSEYLLYTPTITRDHKNHKNNVIQAFLIIAYLLFILSLLLLLILSYSNLKGNKVMSVFTAIFLFIAGNNKNIVLYLYIYTSLLEVHTNQRRFQCNGKKLLCGSS